MRTRMLPSDSNIKCLCPSEERKMQPFVFVAFFSFPHMMLFEPINLVGAIVAIFRHQINLFARVFTRIIARLQPTDIVTIPVSCSRLECHVIVSSECYWEMRFLFSYSCNEIIYNLIFFDYSPLLSSHVHIASQPSPKELQIGLCGGGKFLSGFCSPPSPIKPPLKGEGGQKNPVTNCNGHSSLVICL